MPKTPDRSPGPLDEEAVHFESTSESTIAGEVRYTGSYFSFYDDDGEYNPRVAALPTPIEVGQVLVSMDGLTFTSQSPLVSDSGGMLTNDVGHMVVQG